MYQIHFTDGCGIKDLKQLCDVRMNIVMQHRKGRTVEAVYLDEENITEAAIAGLPLEGK